eukprot:Skav217507  [mRNA]  locus=scaffold1908:367552:369365:- [translate_table: standard]
MAALKLLLGFLVLGAASAETGHAEGAESKQNVPTAEEVEPTAVSTNFLHCPCGLDCQKDMGEEHGFQLHQTCSCLSCNLRGAPEMKHVEGSASADDFLALLAEQDHDWDAASVPGDSQLTFCRCGSLENSCRKCEEPSKTRASCPCGTLCLKRLQWNGGVGWCIQRRCLPCP